AYGRSSDGRRACSSCSLLHWRWWGSYRSIPRSTRVRTIAVPHGISLARVVRLLWCSSARVRPHLNVTTRAGTLCLSCCPMMCRTTPRCNKPWQLSLQTARGSGSSRPARGRPTPAIMSPPCCRADVAYEKRRCSPVSKYSSIPGAGHSDAEHTTRHSLALAYSHHGCAGAVVLLRLPKSVVGRGVAVFDRQCPESTWCVGQLSGTQRCA